VTRADTLTFLAATPLFSELDKAALARVAERLRSVHLPAGEALMREGDPADALYLVVSGRLRACVGHGADERAVGEIPRGEVVGELGLLTGEPRSATVRAVRDSHLLKLAQADFMVLVKRRPTVLLGINRLLSRRLQRTIRVGTPPGRGVRTVAVVPAGAGTDLTRFSEQLVQGLGQFGSAILLNRERLSSQLRYANAVTVVGERMVMDRTRLASHLTEREPGAPPADAPDAETTRWLHNLEAAEDFVIYQADPEPSPWTTRCLRQADRILLVADARRSPALNPVERALEEQAHQSPRDRETDLVLLYRPGDLPPKHTARWLGRRDVTRHHHLVADTRTEMARLARALTGRQVALVLGGGGARGAAHIGVLRALEEHGIPVDAVGGTSFGAIMAAGPALGWSAAALKAGVKRALVDPGPPVDYTLPFVALTKGAKATAQIRATFGDTRIEDMRLPYFCVSSNLTLGRIDTHTEGPLWHAIRASVAFPGIFPPVRSSDGDVLVDGGIMNNLPVDVMRAFRPGAKLLAVNVRPGMRMPADELPDTGIVSGWSLASRRLNPFAPAPAVPGMLRVLMRAAETANVPSAQGHEEAADFVFDPPVEGYGLLDFHAYETLVEIGYRHAMERLEAWPDTATLAQAAAFANK